MIYYIVSVRHTIYTEDTLWAIFTNIKHKD